MKKLILLFTLILFISCTTEENKIPSKPSIYNKWYFKETTPCGKNSIEFKENNLFIENHYSSTCNINTYYKTFILENNTITINGIKKIITELSDNKLTLFDTQTNIYTYYTKP